MKSIPKELVNYIWNRDDHTCRLCGRRLSKGEGVIHHLWKRNEIIPQEIGIPRVPSNNHPLNLVFLCGPCHAKIHNSIDFMRTWRFEALEMNVWLARRRNPYRTRYSDLA